MTKKSSVIRPGKSAREKFAYVDKKIPMSEKQKFESFCAETEAELWEVLDTLGQEGYNFKLSYDQENNCFRSSVTIQEPRHLNYNKALMSRGGSMEEVLFMAVYKMQVWFDFDSWPVEDLEDTWG